MRSDIAISIRLARPATTCTATSTTGVVEAGEVGTIEAAAVVVEDEDGVMAHGEEATGCPNQPRSRLGLVCETRRTI